MNETTGEDDHTAAVPLEISQETAEQAEEVLRSFAEDAEMDMALIVDRSGSLVAGIAADAGVSVETISALVAGVCGAVDALVGEIGESGEIESFHSGGERQMYLKELENRFILVGVSNAELPTGIIRQKSAQIHDELTGILRDIQASSETAAASAKRRRSLHSVVPSRKAGDPVEEDEKIQEGAETFRSEIVLESPAVDEPAGALEASGVESPFSLDSEPDSATTGEGIRFDDLSGLTDPSTGAETEENLEEVASTQDLENPFELDESDEADEAGEVDDLISGTGLSEEDRELLELDREETSEEEEPNTVERIPETSPPVLVTPVVVDSPFEAVDDEEDDAESERAGSRDEEVILPSQPGPTIGKTGEEEETKLNLPQPSKPGKPREETEEEPEQRKSGPRYSFELG